MRTLVDIPQSSLEALNAMARTRSVSRAELVRQAIAEYLEGNTTGASSAPGSATHSAIRDAFGAWSEDFEDGLTYQERLRSEWER